MALCSRAVVCLCCCPKIMRFRSAVALPIKSLRPYTGAARPLTIVEAALGHDNHHISPADRHEARPASH